MPEFIPWNSRVLDEWREKYAQGNFISLNGRSTHYIEKGNGNTVILMHGFTMELHTWIHIDYDYKLYTEQLLLFMDAMAINKASVIGHSMGGGTAINFSVNHRDRVNKLILVDAAGMPSSLPLRAKFFTLPGVGEFLQGVFSIPLDL
jgi:pimeloyl-ACP methyl ester carboxylesterase